MSAPEPVRIEDIDQRLVVVSGRTVRLQVLIDHDIVSTGRCPTCGWVPLPHRRECPSRAVALALLDGGPLPSWLTHLVDRIPGARPDRPVVFEEERHAEDELQGLFPAPRRVPPRRQR